MWIRVCRYKNAGVAGYAEAFIPVQSDSQASEWYSYFENAVLDMKRKISPKNEECPGPPGTWAIMKKLSVFLLVDR